MTGSENEDLEQEVYIKAWQNLNEYEEKGKFTSWINTITSNLCRDYLKSAYFRNSKNSISDDESLLKLQDKKTDIENEFVKRQRQNQVLKAIDNLKPKFRQVVIMYEIMEMDYEEISKKLNCPIGTVKSRLFNARKELSITLKDLI